MLRGITLFSFFILVSLNLKAEIIDIKTEEKRIGDWQILCEIDEMMGSAHCKVASKFFEKTSVISFDPSSKMQNQLLMVIPPAQIGSFVKIRVDRNDLIFSDVIKNSDFGLIPLNDEYKFLLLEQMKKGEFLFIRFNIRDSEEEITAKISLDDFRKSLDYYRNKTK